MKIHNNRRAFLNSLPSDSERIPLVKIIGVLLLGIILSFVFVIAFSPVIQRVHPNFQQFAGVTIQDFPIISLFIWMYYRYRKSHNSIVANLSPAKRHNTRLITIFSYLLMFGVTFFVFYLMMRTSNEPINYTDVSSFYEAEINTRYVMMSLLGLVFYFMLAFFEEFVFRFVIFRNLRAKGLVYAVVISSLIFAIAHMNIGLPFSFLAGVIFALHYEYTNSLLATAALHALHNYLSFFYASYLVIKLLA